jgi:hypothetical protein
MEPISLTIATLVSATLRAVTRSAQDVIYEGYLDLKSAILTRHADHGVPALVQATKALEEQPNAELRQAVLPMELERVGTEATAPKRSLGATVHVSQGILYRRCLGTYGS